MLGRFLKLGTWRDWHDSTLGHAVVGAVLLWVALPPLDLWPLAWLAPVWWVRLARRKELSGRRPYAVLWLAGFGFWMAALHWLLFPHPATSIGWVALAFYLGFYLPGFVGLTRVAVHRMRIPVLVAAPVVWTGLELARAHLFTGITMGSLAHTQFRWLELIQVSDLGGAYAVDFVVMFTAASLATMFPCEPKRRTFWPLVPALVMLAVVVGYGFLRLSGERAETKTARIALIQGSIDCELKADPNSQYRIHTEYSNLTKKAASRFDSLDAIVWPETMFRNVLVTYSKNAAMPDGYPYNKAQFKWALEDAARRTQNELAVMARRYDAALILGIDTEHYGPDGPKRYNSAIFVDRDGRLQEEHYDKMHRVLFGEFVPLADHFSWLQRLTPLPSSLAAGTRPAAFDLDGLLIAPNICYESVLPHAIRHQVTTLARAGREPDVLVNLTNDGWFRGSSELDMHLTCGVFRAVECRKPFLIAANTGFSAWIDADGRIRAQGPRRSSGVLLAEVGPDPRSSWYAKHGDLPAGVCLAACLMLAMVGSWHRFREKRAPKPVR